MESIARFGLSAKDLMSQAAKRQQELTDPAMRDDLVIWKIYHLTLLTESFLVPWLNPNLFNPSNVFPS